MLRQVIIIITIINIIIIIIIIYSRAGLKGNRTRVGCYLLEWRIETTYSNTLDTQERSADSNTSKYGIQDLRLGQYFKFRLSDLQVRVCLRNELLFL